MSSPLEGGAVNPGGGGGGGGIVMMRKSGLLKLFGLCWYQRPWVIMVWLAWYRGSKGGDDKDVEVMGGLSLDRERENLKNEGRSVGTWRG